MAVIETDQSKLRMIAKMIFLTRQVSSRLGEKADSLAAFEQEFKTLVKGKGNELGDTAKTFINAIRLAIRRCEREQTARSQVGLYWNDLDHAKIQEDFIIDAISKWILKVLTKEVWR